VGEELKRKQRDFSFVIQLIVFLVEKSKSKVNTMLKAKSGSVNLATSQLLSPSDRRKL